MARLSDYVRFTDNRLAARHEARPLSMGELHEAYLDGSLDIPDLAAFLDARAELVEFRITRDHLRFLVTRMIPLRGLAQLYAQSPGLHRVLTIEGLRVAKSERVHAFDRRVIELVRYFLTASRAPLRVTDVEAASFIIYQSVRATMLAHLLERPHGLDVDRLIEELTRFLTSYVLGGGEPSSATLALGPG